MTKKVAKEKVTEIIEALRSGEYSPIALMAGIAAEEDETKRYTNT